MWFLEPQPKWNPSHTPRFLGFSRWLCQKTLSFARGLSECNPGFFYSRMTRRCMPCQILVTFSAHSAKPRRNGKRQFLQENAPSNDGVPVAHVPFTDLFFPDCRGVCNSEIPNIFTGKSIKHDSMISSRSSASPPQEKKNTKGHFEKMPSSFALYHHDPRKFQQPVKNDQIYPLEKNLEIPAA